MTPEQQRIAIAEACGKNTNRDLGYWSGSGMHGFSYDPLGLIPDYLSDLNAIHEAEKTMSKDQTYTFNALLIDLKKGAKDADSYAKRWTWHATAAQRAEAFLRTVGRWEA